MDLEIIRDYLNDAAPVLFFRIDQDGRILAMNRHARCVCGEPGEEMRFQDIVIDFYSVLGPEDFSETGSKERLFSVNTLSGSPQSYLFVFKRSGNDILVFGHLDFEDVEIMRTEVVSLNQELGNLTRSLHKKNSELQYALNHVQTLQGIIPICMHCHKIRTEKQVWDQLEKYISERTSAELSHSICPECLEKYYPDLPEDEDC